MTDEERTEGRGAEGEGLYRPVLVDPMYLERDEPEGVSLLQLLNVLLRHGGKVIGSAVVLAVAVGLHSVAQPRTYTSEASFAAETGGTGGRTARISGLASQFGIEIPTGGEAQSPQFYVDLLRSRRILRQAVRTEYRIDSLDAARSNPEAAVLPSDGGNEAAADRTAGGSRAASGTAGRWASLVEHYGIDTPDPTVRVAAAVSRLRGSLSVSTRRETGVVELSVTTGNPALSRQVAQRLIELVNQYNVDVRQSQARAEAEFIRERLREAQAELRAAEDSLERFLERNRRFQNSPNLQFEHDRLQRRVQLKQSVYTSLSQSYEQARINEVKNTPVITVVESPQLPPGPDPRGTRRKVVLTLLLGGMVGTFWAFGMEFMEAYRRKDEDDYQEFVTLRRDLVRRFRRAARRARGLLERRGSGESGTDT